VGQVIPFPTLGHRRPFLVGHALAGESAAWQLSVQWQTHRGVASIDCRLQQAAPGEVSLEGAWLAFADRPGFEIEQRDLLRRPGDLSAALTCLWMELDHGSSPRSPSQLIEAHARIRLPGTPHPIDIEAAFASGPTGLRGGVYYGEDATTGAWALHGQLRTVAASARRSTG